MPVTDLHTADFAAFAHADTPVLVDFYAQNSAPCRRIAQVLDTVAAARPTLPIGQVDVDTEKALANAWVVRQTPTLLLLQQRELTHRWTGETPVDAILTAVDTASLAPTAENAEVTNAVPTATPPTPPLFWNGTLSPHLYNTAIPDLPDGSSPVSPEWPMW